MTPYCHDRDLLNLEPVLFHSGGLGESLIARGQSAGVSGLTLTADADFAAAAVSPGMVALLRPGEGSAAQAVEVLAVTSPTTLSVCLPRADDLQPCRPAGPVEHCPWELRSFAPQIAAVSLALGEKLRRLAEVSGVGGQDFPHSAQLRQTAVYGVLAALFAARAENATATGDPNWIKAQHYRQAFLMAQVQLHLAGDADGDGLAESARSLGHVTLRRI